MLKTFSLGCLGLLFSGALGCAAEVAPTDTGAHEPAPAAEQTAEGQSFEGHCNDVGLWGGAAITFVCTLPFLPIFF